MADGLPDNRDAQFVEMLTRILDRIFDLHGIDSVPVDDLATENISRSDAARLLAPLFARLTDVRFRNDLGIKTGIVFKDVGQDRAYELAIDPRNEGYSSSKIAFFAHAFALEASHIIAIAKSSEYKLRLSLLYQMCDEAIRLAEPVDEVVSERMPDQNVFSLG